MSNLQGQAGELHFTLTVKRAETGKTETFQMVGKILPDGESINLADQQTAQSKEGESK